KPGEDAALVMMQEFLMNRLKNYATSRTDPLRFDAQSNLSPYLRHGNLSPARIVFSAMSYRAQSSRSYEAFVDELFVRRELAENYCFYNPNYATLEGAPEWARLTLDAHRGDPRKWVYSLEEFDKGQTHDDLWNAAQLHLKKMGKMPGYLRMYWGKKILEWTSRPEDAMEIATWLNDRYSIDGGDTGGHVGIAWCIAGVHDQGWKERPIFGKIRYMNYEGCQRKFSISTYIELVKGLTS
ncbi:MAG: deoxyribodipyrimidine photolyase, partial [archaeon]|nr:deoxyribodipyrimidine photolyase [archaeon]